MHLTPCDNHSGKEGEMFSQLHDVNYMTIREKKK